MWPSIPLVVPQATLGTAMGLATSVQMIGIGISNLVVGQILGTKSRWHKWPTFIFIAHWNLIQYMFIHALKKYPYYVFLTASWYSLKYVWVPCIWVSEFCVCVAQWCEDPAVEMAVYDDLYAGQYHRLHSHLYHPQHRWLQTGTVTHTHIRPLSPHLSESAIIDG